MNDDKANEDARLALDWLRRVQSERELLNTLEEWCDDFIAETETDNEQKDKNNV